MRLPLFLHCLMVQHITWYPCQHSACASQYSPKFTSRCGSEADPETIHRRQFSGTQPILGVWERRQSSYLVPVDLSAREHSWAHVHTLFVSVSLCFGCVWLRCLQLISCWDWEERWIFPQLQLAFMLLCRKGQDLFSKYHVTNFFFRTGFLQHPS